MTATNSSPEASTRDPWGRSVMETASGTAAETTPSGPTQSGVLTPSSPVGFGHADAVLMLVLIALVVGQFVSGWFTAPALQTWCTMFVAIVLQAVPFLVLGVLTAAAISQFVTEPMLERILPRNPITAVPAAGLAGIALPGCECASVPIAASLIRSGAAPAAAFTFLLAGPAVNPVVMVATSLAFPGRPEMVAARFAASLLTSVVVGWLWALRGGKVPLRLTRPTGHGHTHGDTAGSGHVRRSARRRALVDEARYDFVHTGGFLMIGAGVAAAVNTFLPRSILLAVANHQVLSVVVMALFALVVAMCSEADAFVAASMTAFSDLSRLVFLVVGPAVDVKLIALHTGYFGRRFAMVFAPLAFFVAVCAALFVGGLVL